MNGLDGLPFSLQGDALVPHFLTAADDPWLGLLIEEVARFEGQPRRLLDAHLRGRLPFAAPADRLRLARQTLLRLVGAEVVAAIPPRRARATLFGAAAGRPHERAAVLAEVAGDLGVGVDGLEAALFADLPGERRVQEPDPPPTVAEVRVRANLRLVQGLLERSALVRLRLEGNARPVVRQARLRGLICTVLGDEGSDTVRLDVSGPLALFKRTQVYGHALAELVPQLCWCNRFYLDADVPVGAGTRRLILTSGAPIFPGKAPKRFDSAVEERFARDFARATRDWDIVREPEPLPAGRALIFPDFVLTHRQPPFERWFLEIVGFWTPEYLRKKLAALALVGLTRLILCIDARRACGDDELPRGAQVIRYDRRIDVERVLAVLDAPLAAGQG